MKRQSVEENSKRRDEAFRVSQSRVENSDSKRSRSKNKQQTRHSKTGLCTVFSPLMVVQSRSFSHHESCTGFPRARNPRGRFISRLSYVLEMFAVDRTSKINRRLMDRNRVEFDVSIFSRSSSCGTVSMKIFQYLLCV